MVPFSMTLSDLSRSFQGHLIFWTWNNVAASRGLLETAKFLYYMYYITGDTPRYT